MGRQSARELIRCIGGNFDNAASAPPRRGAAAAMGRQSARELIRCIDGNFDNAASAPPAVSELAGPAIGGNRAVARKILRLHNDTTTRSAATAFACAGCAVGAQ